MPNILWNTIAVNFYINGVPTHLCFLSCLKNNNPFRSQNNAEHNNCTYRTTVLELCIVTCTQKNIALRESGAKVSKMIGKHSLRIYSGPQWGLWSSTTDHALLRICGNYICMFAYMYMYLHHIEINIHYIYKYGRDKICIQDHACIREQPTHYTTVHLLCSADLWFSNAALTASSNTVATFFCILAEHSTYCLALMSHCIWRPWGAVIWRVSLSSLRSNFVPTRTTGVFGQWCSNSGYH